MDFRNCVRCGKLFTYISKPICDNCVLKEEEDFIRIKEYIDDNPGSSLVEISTATDVPASRIMKLLREGRLELSKGSSDLLTCERCGKSITSGRFCESCLVGLNNIVNEMFSKSHPELKANDSSSSNNKMYTYEKNKRR